MVAQILGPDGIIILVVLGVLLMFGGRQLPKLARGLGGASKEFRKGVTEGDPVPAEPTAVRHSS